MISKETSNTSVPKSKVARHPKNRGYGVLLGLTCLVLILVSIGKEIFKPQEEHRSPKQPILTASQADTRVWVEPIDLAIEASQNIKAESESIANSISTAEKLLADLQAQIQAQKTRAQQAAAQRRLTAASNAYQLSENSENRNADKFTQLFAGANQFANAVAEQPVSSMTAQQQRLTDLKIFQGKVIPGILDTAVNSDLPGMVRATISEDVFAETGRQILLPRGTRLIGQYNSAVTTGQARVYIIWTRAITPQQIDIRLASPGVDSLGRSGLAGKVDNHFWDIFGTSMLLSVMAVGAADIETPNSDSFYGNPYQVEVVESFTENSDKVLEKNLNIKPTLTIDQGTPIRIMVAHDLDFSGLIIP